MRHFPIFMDLEGRRALVLGAGDAADRKAEALQRCGAEVVRAVVFDEMQLQSISVAIAADAAEADILALVDAVTVRGIPVNVVDRPALCSFITPAVVDRSPMTPSPSPRAGPRRCWPA